MEEALADAQTLAADFFSVVTGGELGAEERIPKLENNVDLYIFLLYAAAMLVINWSIRIVVVQPFARLVGVTQTSKNQKFAQAAMELMTYGSFTIFGLLIVPKQPWAWPSSQWWEGFAKIGSPEYPGPHSKMSTALCCYYIMYASRYFQGMISVLIEHKRKDFVEMQIHHIATVLLVGVSYIYGWNRVGVVVMLLLDPADVPLQAAKMMKYVAEARCPGQTENVYQSAADRLFEFFAVVFFVTRIVFYPYVCWSAHIEATRFFSKGGPEWTCVALLYILLVLQVYWFTLLAKVAYTILVLGKPVEDIRSDDEEEDDGKRKPMARKKAQ